MAKLIAKNPLLGILTIFALTLILTMTIQPLVISLASNVLSNFRVNAQLLNDRDNDAIEDENDPCPDDPDTSCTTPDNEAVLPGINAPIDQAQEQDTGGTNETTPGTSAGVGTETPEIVFCIPSKEVCNQTDVLINEAGDLICDPKERDCSQFISQQTPTQPAGQQETGVSQLNTLTPQEVCGNGLDDNFDNLIDEEPCISQSEGVQSGVEGTQLNGSDTAPEVAPIPGVSQLNTVTPSTGVKVLLYCSPSSVTLKIKSKGPGVTNLQNILIDLGYSVGLKGADGDFGTKTKAAVIKFQQDRGLTESNGEVGPETWNELCTAIGPPTAANVPPAATMPAPSEVNCDPSKSEIVYPSKVYEKGIWLFLYGVYKGQGLFVKHLSANSNPLLDSLSVPHFKIEYGNGKSKIIRFCDDETTQPVIFSEVNQAGKKYDRLAWAFEKVMNEPDLKGVLHINYDIFIRTDPIKNCELSESNCYRFVPTTSFTWEGTGPPAIPVKLNKFTAFYKLDYGDNAGVVEYSDPNLNLAAAAIAGRYVDFDHTESKFRAVTDGQEGHMDNFHNAHLGQLVKLPGCRNTDGDCLHMHWRWGDMTPTIDPLVDTITDVAVDESKEGEPYLVPGQTIDVAIVKYYAQEAYSTDPVTLVNGETISSSTAEVGAVTEVDVFPPQIFYYLKSSLRPVVWYMASVSDSNHNEFFRHGMFVLDRTK